MSPDLTDIEIDAICAGYVQNAAKVRFLKSMGLVVRQRPNGRPLVNRAHYDTVTSGNRISKTIGMREPSWGVA